MENTMERYVGNKQVFNDSSDLLKLFCCLTEHKHLSISISQPAAEYHLISWTWNKSEMNNTCPIFKKIKLIEDAYQDKCIEAQSIIGKIVFNSNVIYVLHSGSYSRHEILIPFDILSILSRFATSKRHSIDNFNLTLQQEFILLPSSDVEYASKFYSLQKIDSLFNYLGFKGSRIVVHPELFLEFVEILKESCFQKKKESNFIVASSYKSKVISPGEEKCPYSNLSAFEETDLASKRSDKSEKVRMSCLLKSFIKFHSIKSCDDLMSNYRHLNFPLKRCITEVRKQRTSTNRLCNILTKNRQFGGNSLPPNHQCSGRHFAKDVIHTVADDSISVDITENGDEPCSSIRENFIDQEISGKHIKSKIAEIRQKIESISRGINCELIRREQYHFTFMEQCKRISDSTISSRDYNEIYDVKSLQNEVKVSYSDDISDFSLSDIYENTSSRYELIRQSETSNSDSQVPKKNQTSIPHCQVINYCKVNSRDPVQNQSADVNSHKHVLKQNPVLRQNPTSLEKYLRNFRHQLVVVLSTISVPFVALLFS